MQGFLDFQGYYLEDDVHYADHEPKYEQLKLESIEAETKFTDSQIMGRLQGIFTIRCACWPQCLVEWWSAHSQAKPRVIDWKHIHHHCTLPSKQTFSLSTCFDQRMDPASPNFFGRDMHVWVAFALQAKEVVQTSFRGICWLNLPKCTSPCSANRHLHSQVAMVRKFIKAAVYFSIMTCLSVYCRAFALRIKEQLPSRMVRTLNIYMCNHPLSELSELKGRPEVWEKVQPGLNLKL